MIKVDALQATMTRQKGKEQICRFMTNLRNLLCMAENIFEDATEVVKENCKVI